VGQLILLAGQNKASRVESREQTLQELEIASRFAPVFYQALGDKPRSDYITRFDFDGDWRGDNNWANVDRTDFPLKAFVYFSVAETATHLFIHYAVFHPRDYKGGEHKGTILSELIREGVKLGGKYDPTGLSEEAALAHENDLEGCLVVVAKNGSDLERARVVFVETLHHNTFSRYAAGEIASKGFELIKFAGQRPKLYIEPKGHGIEAFLGGEKQVAGKIFLVYNFSGKAEEPEAGKSESPVCGDPERIDCEKPVGYDLLPISTTLWSRAKDAPNVTYATKCDYGTVIINVQEESSRVANRKVKVGEIGCAFLGRVGGHDMARPPWAWFDNDQREAPPGRWFFDPAATIKNDFHLDDSFSTVYRRLPFWTVDPSKAAADN
jgi:hypothetical protein